MDPKRVNAPVAGRQGASRSSIASRQASNPNVGRKYGSEVSLTPSQARQGGMVENARKSPLDALSRTNYRPNDPFQRRSGLQDVDDSFLAANAFARPTRVRNTGEVGSAVAAPAVAPLRVASGQEMQMPPVQATVPVVQQQQPIVQQQQLPPAAVAMPAQQQALPPQQQQPQQYVQPPAAGQPTRHDPYQGGRAHVQHQHQHQHHHSQQQLPPQSQSQAGYEPQQQQQPQQAPMEVPVQAQAAPAQVQQQPQAAPAQLSPRKYAQQQQQQQGYANPPAPTASTAGVPPAAEMCTTCPNCQTTIYLVRSPEMGNGDGAMPMQ